MVDTAALQTELAALQAARTRLLTGSQKESVSFGDRRVQYTAANLDRLEARIRSLESQLGINTARARRPIGISH